MDEQTKLLRQISDTLLTIAQEIVRMRQIQHAMLWLTVEEDTFRVYGVGRDNDAYHHAENLAKELQWVDDPPDTTV